MRSASLGIDYAAMTAKAAEMLKDNETAAAAAKEAGGTAVGEKRAAESPAEGAPAPAAAKPKVEADAPMPENWATAKDAQVSCRPFQEDVSMSGCVVAVFLASLCSNLFLGRQHVSPCLWLRT